MIFCYILLKNVLNGGYYGICGVMLRIVWVDEVDFCNDILDVYIVNCFINSNINLLI